MPDIGQDIEVYAGEIRTIVVTITNNNDRAVEDLTGASVSWKVKSGSTTHISKSVGSGITLASDPTTGVCSIALQASDTSSLSGSYSHEVRVTLADGTIATTTVGRFIVRPTLI
jgi:hypothetical protein